MVTAIYNKAYLERLKSTQRMSPPSKSFTQTTNNSIDLGTNRSRLELHHGYDPDDINNNNKRLPDLVNQENDFWAQPEGEPFYLPQPPSDLMPPPPFTHVTEGLHDLPQDANWLFGDTESEADDHELIEIDIASDGTDVYANLDSPERTSDLDGIIGVIPTQSDTLGRSRSLVLSETDEFLMESLGDIFHEVRTVIVDNTSEGTDPDYDPLVETALDAIRNYDVIRASALALLNDRTNGQDQLDEESGDTERENSRWSTRRRPLLRQSTTSTVGLSRMDRLGTFSSGASTVSSVASPIEVEDLIARDNNRLCDREPCSVSACLSDSGSSPEDAAASVDDESIDNIDTHDFGEGLHQGHNYAAYNHSENSNLYLYDNPYQSYQHHNYPDHYYSGYNSERDIHHDNDNGYNHENYSSADCPETSDPGQSREHIGYNSSNQSYPGQLYTDRNNYYSEANNSVNSYHDYNYHEYNNSGNNNPYNSYPDYLLAGYLCVDHNRRDNNGQNIPDYNYLTPNYHSHNYYFSEIFRPAQDYTDDLYPDHNFHNSHSHLDHNYHSHKHPDNDYHKHEHPDYNCHGHDYLDYNSHGHENPYCNHHGHEHPDHDYHIHEYPCYISHGHEHPDYSYNGEEYSDYNSHEHTDHTYHDHNYDIRNNNICTFPQLTHTATEYSEQGHPYHLNYTDQSDQSNTGFYEEEVLSDTPTGDDIGISILDPPSVREIGFSEEPNRCELKPTNQHMNACPEPMRINCMHTANCNPANAGVNSNQSPDDLRVDGDAIRRTCDENAGPEYSGYNNSRSSNAQNESDHWNNKEYQDTNHNNEQAANQGALDSHCQCSGYVRITRHDIDRWLEETLDPGDSDSDFDIESLSYQLDNTRDINGHVTARLAHSDITMQSSNRKRKSGDKELDLLGAKSDTDLLIPYKRCLLT